MFAYCSYQQQGYREAPEGFARPSTDPESENPQPRSPRRKRRIVRSPEDIQANFVENPAGSESSRQSKPIPIPTEAPKFNKRLGRGVYEDLSVIQVPQTGKSAVNQRPAVSVEAPVLPAVENKAFSGPVSASGSADWEFCRSLPGVYKLCELLLSFGLFVCTTVFAGWFSRGGVFLLYFALVLLLLLLILFTFRVYSLQLPLCIPLQTAELLLHPFFLLISIVAAVLALVNSPTVWSSSNSIQIPIALDALFSLLLSVFFIGDFVVYLFHCRKEIPIN